MGRVYKMKALCLVAHPDDCVIFGYGFIKQYDYDWTIAYLTHDIDDPRSHEMKKFWHKHGVYKIIYGSFNDEWEKVQNNELGFDAKDAENFCKKIIFTYDLLLTHNFLGEYGHLHHKFINKSIENTKIPKVYFGNFPQFCNKIINQEPFDLDDLPIHKDVVKGFDNSTYKYYITPEAQVILS